MKEESIKYFLYKVKEIKKEFINAKNDLIVDIANNTDFYEEASIKELNELEELFDNILKDGNEDKLMLFAEKYLISKDHQFGIVGNEFVPLYRHFFMYKV